MVKICFATNNQHKLREIQAILGDSFELITLKDIQCLEELPETNRTIEANSMQKAQFVWDHYQIPCFADDSGVEVFALNGEPGVDSAYYAGPQKNDEENLLLLLKNMEGVINRSAQFKTVVTFVDGHITQQFEGIIKGTIIQEKRGQNGFGYDPIFIPDGFEKTFAEMSLEEKKAISHRSIAFLQLQKYLKNYILT